MSEEIENSDDQMNELMEEVSLDGSTGTFDINELGERTRQGYIGTFKVKCFLTPMEDLKSDKLYRQIMGPNMIMASETIKNTAFALSTLKYRVIEAPPFWEDRELDGSHVERNIVIAVLNLAVAAEEKYVRQKIEEAEAIEKRLTDAIKNNTLEKEESEEIDVNKQNDPEETGEVDLD